MAALITTALSIWSFESAEKDQKPYQLSLRHQDSPAQHFCWLSPVKSALPSTSSQSHSFFFFTFSHQHQRQVSLVVLAHFDVFLHMHLGNFHFSYFTVSSCVTVMALSTFWPNTHCLLFFCLSYSVVHEENTTWFGFGFSWMSYVSGCCVFQEVSEEGSIAFHTLKPGRGCCVPPKEWRYTTPLKANILTFFSTERQLQ